MSKRERKTRMLSDFSQLSRGFLVALLCSKTTSILGLFLLEKSANKRVFWAVFHKGRRAGGSTVRAASSWLGGCSSERKEEVGRLVRRQEGEEGSSLRCMRQKADKWSVSPISSIGFYCYYNILVKYVPCAICMSVRERKVRD